MLRNDANLSTVPIRAGFTLIELAVAVFILGLLLSGILLPLGAQFEQQQVSAADKVMDEARESIAGFAIINGYLPCPDKTTAAGAGTANDGIEDVAGGACVGTTGNLPTVTLGMRYASDPWGNRLRYRVVVAFAQRPPAFNLTTPADIRVCENSTCARILTDSAVPGNEAAVVVLSHGKNGYGAINYESGAANPAPTSADELANVGTGIYVSRAKGAPGSGSGEFDDIVMWLGRAALGYSLIAAGKIP